MARRPPSPARLALADHHDPQGLAAFVLRHLEWLRVHNYAEPTVANRELYLGYFVAWCAERGLTQPKEITKPILERYQRALYHLRKANGAPLTFRGQHARLVPIRGFFRWLTRQNYYSGRKVFPYVKLARFVRVTPWVSEGESLIEWHRCVCG
jgi:integrase/recombinase XerD